MNGRKQRKGAIRRESTGRSSGKFGRTRFCRPSIEYIRPVPQLPGLLGIYFYDPNGIRLEFAGQPEDGETPAVIPWRCSDEI